MKETTANQIKNMKEQTRSSQTTSSWVALGCLTSSLNFKETAGAKAPKTESGKKI